MHLLAYVSKQTRNDQPSRRFVSSSQEVPGPAAVEVLEVSPTPGDPRRVFSRLGGLAAGVEVSNLGKT